MAQNIEIDSYHTLNKPVKADVSAPTFKRTVLPLPLRRKTLDCQGSKQETL